MSAAYHAVGWNRQKRRYDTVIAAGVLLYLAVFLSGGALLHPDATAETLLLRALGTCAMLLLHVVLSIGPLCRLNPAFLPLLYNRRHLGVATFLVGLAHGTLALVQFHGLGNTDPFTSLLASSTRFGSLTWFPFQQLGAAALGVLFLMAATSHDFWLSILGPRAWKALHMGVYAAWALLLAHVVLGVLMAETSPVLAGVLCLGAAWVLALHLLAASAGRKADQPLDSGVSPGADGYVEICDAAEIPENRARVACLSGERVAIFRHDGRISAISNACRHQHGPLGEGRILDGCVTCPWHGYQYRPETGQSPPPFTEAVPIFRARVVDGRVWLHPQPLAPGTPVEPAPVDGMGRQDHRPFYIGWEDRAPAALAAALRRLAVGLPALAAALAVVLVAAQAPFAVAAFEYSTVRAFEGTLVAWPHPILLVERPGRAEPRHSAWLLVNPGKHGADATIEGMEDHRVRLRGSLIYRDDRTMIEMIPDSVEDLGLAPPLEAPLDLGEHFLVGEIVDSKCFLGVMKPGNLKPHRDCAVRCLSGGIPPLFLVRDESGASRQLLLTGPSGEAIGPMVLDRVAEPIKAHGRVEKRGDMLIFRVDPENLRRIE